MKMINLFSVFDPSSSLPLITNWVSIFFWALFLALCLWTISSPLSNFLTSFMVFSVKEIKVILPSKSMGASLFLLTIFSFISVSNLLGLLPFSFTPTSHPLISLSLALPVWLSLFIFSALNQTMNLLSHLVPAGTPPALIPFMVIIESLSMLIRPLALAIRLAANMIAGHLLVSLLGNYGSLNSHPISMSVLLSGLPLMGLELAVAVIQGYVFMILLTLYLNEV